jgi:hypothetical protein
MTGILFYPFDIVKWFMLGFSAWLAVMFSGRGIGGGLSLNYKQLDLKRGAELLSITGRFKELLKLIFTGEGSFIGKVSEHFQIGESIFWLIISGTAAFILIIIIINLLLLWLSSRFKFVFIHNLANNLCEISAPWKRFKNLGNSAFLWLLCFMLSLTLFMLIIFVLASSLFYPVFIDFLQTGTLNPGILNSFLSGLTLLLFFCGITVFSFTYYFFDQFVILIMYKDNISAVPAYWKFLRMLKSSPISYVKFWFLQILANFVCVAAIIAFVLCTCCIAAVLLAVPYIGAVAILPVTVFRRLQAMELMAAFGKDFSPYPAPAPQTASKN